MTTDVVESGAGTAWGVTAAATANLAFGATLGAAVDVVFVDVVVDGVAVDVVVDGVAVDVVDGVLVVDGVDDSGVDDTVADDAEDSVDADVVVLGGVELGVSEVDASVVATVLRSLAADDSEESGLAAAKALTVGAEPDVDPAAAAVLFGAATTVRTVAQAVFGVQAVAVSRTDAAVVSVLPSAASAAIVAVNVAVAVSPAATGATVQVTVPLSASTASPALARSAADVLIVAAFNIEATSSTTVTAVVALPLAVFATDSR